MGLFAPVSQCRINILKDLTFVFPHLLTPIRTKRNKRRCQSTTSPMSPVKEQCLNTFPPPRAHVEVERAQNKKHGMQEEKRKTEQQPGLV